MVKICCCCLTSFLTSSSSDNPRSSRVDNHNLSFIDPLIEDLSDLPIIQIWFRRFLIHLMLILYLIIVDLQKQIALITSVPSNLNHISTPVDGIWCAGMVILPRKSSYKHKGYGNKHTSKIRTKVNSLLEEKNLLCWKLCFIFTCSPDRALWATSLKYRHKPRIPFTSFSLLTDSITELSSSWSL